jgi:hypothetical protein
MFGRAECRQRRVRVIAIAALHHTRGQTCATAAPSTCSRRWMRVVRCAARGPAPSARVARASRATRHSRVLPGDTQSGRSPFSTTRTVRRPNSDTTGAVVGAAVGRRHAASARNRRCVRAPSSAPRTWRTCVSSMFVPCVSPMLVPNVGLCARISAGRSGSGGRVVGGLFRFAGSRSCRPLSALAPRGSPLRRVEEAIARETLASQGDALVGTTSCLSDPQRPT